MDPTLRLVPLGFQQITDVSGVVGLTVPAGANYARIEAEAQAVRWRDDGSNPSSTVGMTIASGGALNYSGTLSAIKFIQATATAKLNISYYKLVG